MAECRCLSLASAAPSHVRADATAAFGRFSLSQRGSKYRKLEASGSKTRAPSGCWSHKPLFGPSGHSSPSVWSQPFELKPAIRRCLVFEPGETGYVEPVQHDWPRSLDPQIGGRCFGMKSPTVGGRPPQISGIRVAVIFQCSGLVSYT